MDFSLDYTLYYQKEHERRAGVSKPRSGRPKMLNEAEKVRLLDAVHENPRITREDLLAAVSHKVETPSIQPLLNAENLWKWRCSWRPYLTEEYAFKRRQWAFRYQHFTLEDWARVFLSDDYTVEHGIGVRREWTFTRLKDQPKLGQVQGIPQRGKQVK